MALIGNFYKEDGEVFVDSYYQVANATLVKYNDFVDLSIRVRVFKDRQDRLNDKLLKYDFIFGSAIYDGITPIGEASYALADYYIRRWLSDKQSELGIESSVELISDTGFSQSHTPPMLHKDEEAEKE
jgi:hypothetical protein